MWLSLASLVFGGVPFGATEAELKTAVSTPLKEEKLGDGSRALSRIEKIAGHNANRKWVIQDGKFVEGVLLFGLDTDNATCTSLLRTALSSIESNYGVKPVQSEKRDSGLRGSSAETWTVTLPEGGRIEQRYLFVPLINSCTVSGRYFPQPENSAAF